MEDDDEWILGSLVYINPKSEGAEFMDLLYEKCIKQYINVDYQYYLQQHQMMIQ